MLPAIEPVVSSTRAISALPPPDLDTRVRVAMSNDLIPTRRMIAVDSFAFAVMMMSPLALVDLVTLATFRLADPRVLTSMIMLDKILQIGIGVRLDAPAAKAALSTEF